MSLLRDMPITLVAMEERQLITCSTGSQTIVGSTANSIIGTTAGVDPINNTTSTGVMGRVIDRRRPNDGLMSLYQVAIPQVNIFSSGGSTNTNRQLTIGCLLQHGDSSGGGDQTPFSTGSAMFFSTQSQTFVQNLRTYFTTARTSDYSNWEASGLSSGPLRGVTNPMTYDLRQAKRYVSVAVWASKNLVTTASGGDEGARISAQLTFAAGDFERQLFDSTSPLSTSTST